MKYGGIRSRASGLPHCLRRSNGFVWDHAFAANLMDS
jgi:hypothetical protein